MSKIDQLKTQLKIPVIGAPLFLVSGPELVIAQCKSGIVGSFPALNARPQNVLDEWIVRIKDELAEAKEGTIGRSSGGRCILSGSSMPFSYVREQGKSAGLGQRLMAVVAEGTKGRAYLAPNVDHEAAAAVPTPDVPELEQELPKNPRDFKTPGSARPAVMPLGLENKKTSGRDDQAGW